MLAEMTAREMRAINAPTREMYQEAVELLIGQGWEFKCAIFPKGWWINTAHETKCRPTGDPKDFNFGAWDTLKTYIAPERHES